MDQILEQVLRDAVWERLDVLAEQTHRDTASLTSAAASDLPRLVADWRTMLRGHEPDERGDCPTCSTRYHGSQAPCAVWHAAYDHLVAGGLAPEQSRRAGSVAARAHATNTGRRATRASAAPQAARTGAT